MIILQEDVNKWRFIVYINIFCRVFNVTTVHKIFSKIIIIVTLSYDQRTSYKISKVVWRLL